MSRKQSKSEKKKRWGKRKEPDYQPGIVIHKRKKPRVGFSDLASAVLLGRVPPDIDAFELNYVIPPREDKPWKRGKK